MIFGKEKILIKILFGYTYLYNSIVPIIKGSNWLVTYEKQSKLMLFILDFIGTDFETLPLNIIW